jgi:molybdopterin-guanine dinucleotide biosynthesis protein A
MNAAGFVLVGGNSSRMGSDKALLPWRSGRLVEEVADQVRLVAGDVTLIGPPERYSMLPYHCLPDLRVNSGPMAGIEAALASHTAEFNLIVACDMPGIDLNHLEILLQKAKRSNSLCVATKDPCGTVHPLCAVYRSACLPVIKSHLDSGSLKLMNLLLALDAEYLVSEAKVYNVNTPEEWVRCQIGPV